MKKLICILLTIAMVIGLVACAGKSENEGNSNSETSTSQNTEAGKNDGDDNTNVVDGSTDANSTSSTPSAEEPDNAEVGNNDNQQESNTTDSEMPEKTGTHIVVDHAGNEVEVPYEINRIVIADIYPMASVISVFFDSAKKIVGMAGPCMSAAKNGLLGELYPEILNAKTNFIDGANVNIEELMMLEPDVVFYSAGSKDEGELYKNAGIPAIAISPAKWGFNAIETLDNWIALLDELFDGNQRAMKVRDYSDQVFDFVQGRVAEIPEEERLSVFFLFQYTDTNIMTSGKKFFGQWWSEAIGARNVGEELADAGSTAVNMEQIYTWNPDLIFVTNYSPNGPDALYNNTVGDYDWSEVEAVLNKRVYKMPLGMYRSYTCGVDTPVTLLWLAKTAYPSYFEDVDILEETVKYYQTVFRITLTAEQASSIFSPVAAAGSGFNGQGK